MAKQKANEPVEKRRRSPSVPFISLDTAFTRALHLHHRAGRNRFRIADAAGVWGLRAKSSATSQTVAALYAYGLVEAVGRGATRQIRLYEPVARLFEDPPLSPEAQQQVITQAALKPKLIAHYAGEWGADRPGDAVCMAELKAVHGFTEAGAARFLQVFDNAMQLMAGSLTGVGPDNNQESAVSMAPSNGDTARQNRGALHIVQRDRRLEIKADMGLEELRQLAEVLLHYRAILALPLPQSAEALGPELGTSRGIAFPLIGLHAARDTASWLYSYAKREAVLIANVVSAVDQDPKGVSMLQELEALVHFGLAEQSGSGKGRKIRVTDLALRVIEFTNAQIREQGAREAAGRPKLIAHYAALWPDGRPEDSVCLAQLRGEQGLSEEMAARFLKVFDESWSYIKQKQSAVAADPAPDRQPNELTLVLHGCRLELTADIDLAGLDNLRQSLTCYERILQLLTPDRQVGSEIR